MSKWMKVQTKIENKQQQTTTTTKFLKKVKMFKFIVT